MLHELALIAEPLERLVRFIGFLDLDGWSSWRPEIRKAIAEGLPCESVDFEPRSWDQDALQAWFLEAVQEPPADQTFFVTTKLLKRKVVSVPGWCFENGNVERPYEVILLSDGRRGRIDGYPPEFIHSKLAGFNYLALAKMAKLARLTPFPAQPVVKRPRA